MEVKIWGEKLGAWWMGGSAALVEGGLAGMQSRVQVNVLVCPQKEGSVNRQGTRRRK